MKYETKYINAERNSNFIFLFVKFIKERMNLI